MKTRIAISSLAVVAALGLPQLARSLECPPSLLIDDFSTGKHKANLRVGLDGNTQNGSMIGGHRFTNFIVCDPDTPGACTAANQYNQLATFQIRPRQSVLIVDSGIRVFSRLEVFYGFDGQVGIVPLNQSLTCFTKFRVHFDANDLTVNFNMQVIAGNNPAVAQCGVNQPGNSIPFTVDFPFNCFVPNAGPLPDFSDIDLIDLILQSGSAVGANDFAITKVEALP